MNGTKMRRMIYVVVDVTCGVAEEPYTFLRRGDAIRCLRQLRKGRNLDEDDVQLFETEVGKFPDKEVLNA